MVKNKPKFREDDRTPAKRCSDYDEDCHDISDHELCWCGHPAGHVNGLAIGELEMADGYCPLMFKEKNNGL